MAMLEDLRRVDIIGPAVGFMERNRFVLGEDGKIRPSYKKHFKLNSSWLNVKVAEDRNCFLWHIIYFQVYRIISRNCFHCWKVVTSPKTLEDLLKIYKLQVDMGLPSKCGMERRPFARYKANYNAFWYGPMRGGIEAAKELHRTISLKVKDKLGIQTPVILKRGCTEMENDAGPTDKWEYTPEMKMYEDLLESTWEVPRFPYIEPGCLVTNTILNWILHAIENGDPTAKKYYEDLRSLGITSTVFYHDVEREINPLPEIKYLEEVNNEPKIQRLS